jgi:peptide/nickel transport system permease protein
VAAACRQYSRFDAFVCAYTYITKSVPGFFVSFVLIGVFVAILGVLPSNGMYDPNVKSLGSLARHMVLPVAASSIGMAGIFARQSRGAMLEVMGEDYIRTARSKGIKRSAVIFRHAFRNALLPVVTVVGMVVAFIVSGSVIIESIFAWPGIGSLMMTAVGKRDYPVIMGLTVLISATVLVVNLVMDVVYALLDPRISFGKAGAK